MAKVKVTNLSLQVINVLIKEGAVNKNVQLLSKGEAIVNKEQITDQIKRLKDLGILSILPYTETIEV
jgi:hypothetical protein